MQVEHTDSGLEKGQAREGVVYKKDYDANHFPVVVESAKTLNNLFDFHCIKFAEFAAIGMAFETPLTFKEFNVRVKILAAKLQEDGVSSTTKVAILAENSHVWGITYLAIVRLGAVVVPILPDLPEADVHHILGEMGCEMVFTTKRQIEKVYEFDKGLGMVITLDDYHDASGIVSTKTFSEYSEEASTGFSERIAQGDIAFPKVESSDLASILYTSGTSGFSKAVMLTHENLYANALSASMILTIEPGSVFLSVLPVSHTYEFTVGFLLPIIKGCRVVYAGKTPTPAVLQKICEVERPHAMLVVPLIMEKIYKKRVLPAIEKSKILTFISSFKIGRRLLWRKICKKLLVFFGGRLEVMGIGGAPINPEVEAFLKESAFPYIIGYGLTEAAPLLAGGPQGDPSITLGSTGKAVPGVEIRINDPDPVTGIGEVQGRGANIMQGYWNDPEATQETFTHDGWLRTGDLGFIDELSNLHIKGRAKSVIVLANGENIYPEAIEHKLNAYPFVVESLVLDNNGAIEAWIYPDYEFIDAETPGQSRQKRHQYVNSLFQQMRIEVNSQLPVASRLSRVVERREPFVKTATHKIKRYLYASEPMS